MRSQYAYIKRMKDPNNVMTRRLNAFQSKESIFPCNSATAYSLKQNLSTREASAHSSEPLAELHRAIQRSIIKLMNATRNMMSRDMITNVHLHRDLKEEETCS
jgi:hypothetical protein